MSHDDSMELDSLPLSSQFPPPSTYKPQAAPQIRWQASQVSHPILRQLYEQADEDTAAAHQRRHDHAGHEDWQMVDDTTPVAPAPVSHRLTRPHARLHRTKSSEQSANKSIEPSVLIDPTSIVDKLKQIAPQLDANARNNLDLRDKMRRKERGQRVDSAGVKRKPKSKSNSPIEAHPSATSRLGLSRSLEGGVATRTRSLSAMQDHGRETEFSAPGIPARYASMPVNLQTFERDGSMSLYMDADSGSSTMTEGDSPLPVDLRKPSFIREAERDRSISGESKQLSQSLTPPDSPPTQHKAIPRQIGRSSGGFMLPAEIRSRSSTPSTRSSTPTATTVQTRPKAAPTPLMRASDSSSASRTPTPRPTTPVNSNKPITRSSSSRPSAERIRQLISGSKEPSSDSLPTPSTARVRTAPRSRQQQTTTPLPRNQSSRSSSTVSAPAPVAAIRSASSARPVPATIQGPRRSQRPPALGMRGVGATSTYSASKSLQNASHRPSATHTLPPFSSPLLARPPGDAKALKPSKQDLTHESLPPPPSPPSPPPPVDADSSYGDIQPPFSAEELEKGMQPFD